MEASAHEFEWYTRFSGGGGVSTEDDEPTGRPRSTITDQHIAKLRVMRGFPLTSVVRLSIETTALKYQKDFVKELGKRGQYLGLNLADRESILPQLKRFRQRRKISQRAFQKPSSRIVNSNAEGNYFAATHGPELVTGATEGEPCGESRGSMPSRLWVSSESQLWGSK
ncbi:hypothetical protein TNCV_531051 [Trichonephila clavipes]|nr:hypothetical protein TNCV_531051 [Trichonephila clavipes]